MTFLIADTFTDSLARLTGEEQKAVKTTAFDLQMNPASPGMKFHRLEKGKDRNFWSVRVNADLRIIVHRTPGSLLLCYVGHHDKAYEWAERRKLETHPTTGAAQIVEVRETVREIVIPTFATAPAGGVAARRAVLAHLGEPELLAYGVPAEWIPDIRAADEDGILGIAERLPAEAAEALLDLATGGQPAASHPAEAPASPFEHPDAQRRFRVVSSSEELQRALEAPWEKWAIFLHPAQRQLVERQYNGPARVSGSAGTGKTIVAIHRAAYLARTNPDARVLLATFSEPLANALAGKLKRLVGNEPRIGERIEVGSLDVVARRLCTARFGTLSLASREDVKAILRDASSSPQTRSVSLRFLLSEWEQVVDAWQLETWEGYRDVPRLGRRVRLTEGRRRELWDIFERVLSRLRADGQRTIAGVYRALEQDLRSGGRAPYDHVVVDEAQDLAIPQLRFLAALGADRPDGLFFAGDIGQRIFQQPFSWTSLGVDIRGRSRTLRVNYRTSHQIREHADRLLDPELSDADGNREDRSHTISVFNGPPPVIRVLADERQEIEFVAGWLKEQIGGGLQPHEFGVFVRSEAQIPRAEEAVRTAGLSFRSLDEQVLTAHGHVSIGTMHLAKGLEFRAVAVMACDDEVIPLQERIEAVGEEGDLEETYQTERQLLYVACTRARDSLSVTGVAPESEFIGDLGIAPRQPQ